MTSLQAISGQPDSWLPSLLYVINLTTLCKASWNGRMHISAQRWCLCPIFTCFSLQPSMHQTIHILRNSESFSWPLGSATGHGCVFLQAFLPFIILGIQVLFLKFRIFSELGDKWILSCSKYIPNIGSSNSIVYEYCSLLNEFYFVVFYHSVLIDNICWLFYIFFVVSVVVFMF